MNSSFEEFLKVDDTFCVVLEWKDVKWFWAFSKNVQVPTTCNWMWKWLLRTCCWFLIMITHEAQPWNGLCCHCVFVIDMTNVICTCDNWLQYAHSNLMRWINEDDHVQTLGFHMSIIWGFSFVNYFIWWNLNSMSTCWDQTFVSISCFWKLRRLCDIPNVWLIIF